MSEPSLEGEELRKRGKRGVKNDNGQGKHVAQDEGDFVDESILQPCSTSSSSSSSGPNSSKRARHNWSVFSKVLRETLRNQNQFNQNNSLILFDFVPGSQNSDCSWLTFENHKFFRFSLPIRKLSLSTLARGFDNTGNVRIWPGSEALAWCFLQKHQELPNLLENSKVLELGAGFLGLTSFMLAHLSKSTEVWITDGNVESVKSLERNRDLNAEFSNKIHVSQLLWGEFSLDTKFNTIIAADCVFFSEFHEKFLTCIENHLAADGICYISSPKRKGSLESFISYVENSWRRFQLAFCKEWNEMLECKIGNAWKDEHERDEKFPVILTISHKKFID